MIPIVDMHVHLLAGLDDGPKTLDEAEEMCRIMAGEGVIASVALAHQSPRYPDNLAAPLRAALPPLQGRLRQAGIDLQLHPCGEVCLQPDLVERWDARDWLSVGDREQYLLLEFHNDQPVDLVHLLDQLRPRKLRLILAHAERVEEWREDARLLERWVRRGCVVQVTASACVNPQYERVVRDWARRGLVHVLGSDGHSPTRRPPHSRAGVQALEKWLGAEAAGRIAAGNAQTILRGQPLVTELPEPSRRGWFGRLFGN